MSNSQQPSLAFFGATGGCGLAALVRALNAGYTCTALVRTPSKLTNILSSRTPPVSTKTLTIHAGDIHSASSITPALHTPSGAPVSLIVFSIGGTPTLQFNPLRPVTLTDPTVCEAGMTALLSAITTAGIPQPKICAVSTTGLKGPRDVPILLWGLYKWLLHVPHVDKERMERALLAGGGGGRWTVVRPSLLVDGPARGEEGGVRAGYEGRKSGGGWGGRKGMAVGYTISREDVGGWIWKEVIEDGGKEEWIGRKVTLTY